MGHFINTIAILLTVAPFFAAASAQCPQFDAGQIETLQRSYDLGKPHDLGLTLAAIALKESSAGKYVINAVSADYGVYQSNYKTLCKQAGVYHDNFLCNQEVGRVVNNIEKAAEHALKTLQYWQGYHTKRSLEGLVYENTIRSYHEGFGFQTPKADDYYKKYKTAFYTIKQCVRFT